MMAAVASPWIKPETVAGFVKSPPNVALLAFAQETLAKLGSTGVLVDIGCGAARNAEPLVAQGWSAVGVDLSMPMLAAARERLQHRAGGRRSVLACAAMDRLPVATASADFIVAHGIWNLARSAFEFRAAVREARRVAKQGAALFVFTFSRATLSADATPITGEPFVFTQFSGEPQCFLTETQLVQELSVAGFAPDAGVPLRELNRREPGTLAAGAPVVFQSGFRAV